MLPLLTILVFLSGCISTPALYPGTGATPDLREQGVAILGEVTACQGAFCKDDNGDYESSLSLPAPPPAYTYQSILRKKAARTYAVPESDVVLGEMSVGYYAELIGTLRGWETKAMAGKTTGTSPVVAPTASPNNLASPYYSR